MEHILLLKDPKVTLATYEGMSDNNKKLFQDKFGSLWSVRMLVDHHSKKSFNKTTWQTITPRTVILVFMD